MSLDSSVSCEAFIFWLIAPQKMAVESTLSLVYESLPWL